jgi:2-keto-3-deoxy-L-rhamnonate aldolase RhmA
MTGRQVSEALHAGSPVYGTLIVSTSPVWLDHVKSTGVDMVFIDTEHIPIDRVTLSWMCRAYQLAGLAPMVRIPQPDPYQACMALDGGASGVLVPYVESAEQVRSLVGAVKFRPLKGRRLTNFLSGDSELEPELLAYLNERNANSFLVINIESVPAMDSLDQILDVSGIDAVLIGPHDLSCSLGIPEQYNHPQFEKAVHRILGAARSRGLGFGVHFWRSPDQQIVWARAGANLIMHHGDVSIFSQALRHDLSKIKEALQHGTVAPLQTEIEV